MKLTTISILILSICYNLDTSAEEFRPRVTTPLGVIEGGVGLSVNLNPYFKFEGIPYAKPPVGNLRFEEPEDPEPWKGIWKANSLTTCMQYDHFEKDVQNNYRVHGDEDCLYVNVYTHSLSDKANLDVLVFIHGGAFMFGRGASYGPEIIMDRKIVFVNFNYRLGPLGFLSTEDEVIPGNIGLKDQIKALKWVKNNIQYFGGNPDSITIFGLSAGGASVHFHYFTPESKGLFKAGFSQSGCMLNSWVLAENSKEKTEKLAALVGCPTDDSKTILDCLKSKPARQIVQAVKEYQPFLYNPFSPFGAVVDGKWSKNPVLLDHPYKLLKQGKVQDLPWIISYTSHEGLYPAADFYADDQHLIDIDTKWNEIMPFVLHYNETIDQKLKDEVSQTIRDHYLGNNPVNKETYNSLVQLIGDRLFVADIEASARLHSAVTESEVYNYVFSYRGAVSKSNVRTQSNVNIGSSHGDDTIYTMKTQLDTLSTEEDKHMSKILLDLTVSFMNTRKPNITSLWEPVKKSLEETLHQMKIESPTKISMNYPNEVGERSFWHSLPLIENHYLNSIIKDEL
ncbi:venom carboxylesterase-6-like isoform X2 [Sitophilus oryzae]|uniref:Carboxylic ester hydrolase n=1 Tax=Sitophilus oryzae TaxID=7048 RepID=A0A6J2YNN1_SITOR|nr:venom carboxylesterase-6-like isoform X2 [Sitophilus oryzae]